MQSSNPAEIRTAHLYLAFPSFRCLLFPPTLFYQLVAVLPTAFFLLTSIFSLAAQPPLHPLFHPPYLFSLLLYYLPSSSSWSSFTLLYTYLVSQPSPFLSFAHLFWPYPHQPNLSSLFADHAPPFHLPGLLSLLLY